MKEDRSVAINTLERTWKAVVMTYLKVLAWHLTGGTEESREILSDDSVSRPRSELVTSGMLVRIVTISANFLGMWYK
jgi:hypothetical protein